MADGIDARHKEELKYDVYCITYISAIRTIFYGVVSIAQLVAVTDRAFTENTTRSLYCIACKCLEGPFDFISHTDPQYFDFTSHTDPQYLFGVVSYYKIIESNIFQHFQIFRHS